MKVSSYQGIFVKSSDSRSECEHTLPVVPFWKHKECIFHTSEALFSKKQKVKLLHTFIGLGLAYNIPCHFGCYVTHLFLHMQKCAYSAVRTCPNLLKQQGILRWCQHCLCYFLTYNNFVQVCVHATLSTLS